MKVREEVYLKNIHSSRRREWKSSSLSHTHAGKLLRREDLRTSPMNGHPPERDSRLTLHIFWRFHQLNQLFDTVPTGGELRQALLDYNYEKWLKDYGRKE